MAKLAALLAKSRRSEDDLTAVWVRPVAFDFASIASQSAALSAMGSIASRGHGRSQTETDVHFERAMYVLGDAPARITRSIVQPIGRAVVVAERIAAVELLRQQAEAGTADAQPRLQRTCRVVQRRGR